MRRLLLGCFLASLLTFGMTLGSLSALGGDCGCGGGPAPVAYADGGCDSCGGCDECGSCGGCGGCCHCHCNPLMVPLKVLDWVAHLGCCGCSSGCGERYWGECSEPVDCHDPCDQCGNWTGRGCSTCRSGYANGNFSYAKANSPNRTYAQRSPAPRGTYAQRSPQAQRPTYAQRPTPVQRPAYVQRSAQNNNDVVRTEFGLDPSAQVVSRSDQVVAPAQVNPTQARPITAQSVPHLAPVRQ